MDKNKLYSILDIEDEGEFTYYENMASLLEEDQYIEQELLEEFIREVEFEGFIELIGSYFEEFLKKLPDDMTDLYTTVDNFRRFLSGCNDAEEMAEAVNTFRKWYVSDALVIDKDTGDDLCVRDARYNLSASTFIDEPCNYNFDSACEFEFEGYNVALSNLIEEEETEETE